MPPAGWIDVDDANFSYYWEDSSTAYSGSSSAYHSYDFSDTDNDFLVTPVLDLSGCAPGTSITLTYFEQNTLPSWYEGHYVVYTTDPNPMSAGDFTQIEEMGSGTSTWAQRTVALDALAGMAVVRVAFRYYGYNADNWYIDDVSIQVN